MRLTVFCFVFFLACCFRVCAQNDSSKIIRDKSDLPQTIAPAPDSAALAAEKRAQFVADSIGMIYFRPDSLRQDQFFNKIRKGDLFDPTLFPRAAAKAKIIVKAGDLRVPRDQWIIVAIIALLIYTALLNLFMGKEIKSVVETFYNKRALPLADKEGGPIQTWAFIGLFLLFSLTSGLVLSQLSVYYRVYRAVSGLQLFITLSFIVAVLFALKFFLLKFIGFIFDINRYVSQYITILNFTYFNIAFVLLFSAICFSLLSAQFIPYLKVFTVLAIAIIFTWQYLRNSVNIISNFRFHKFYLFIYLCALEICPVLILIKALNI
jgi:hypothetical protein